MGFVVSALVVVFLLCVVDLLLSFGVVRRLRRHTEELAKLTSASRGHSALPELTVAVGSVPGEFAAVDTDGVLLSREDLQTGDGRTVAAFLSPSCPSCAERLAEFVREIPDFLVGKDRAVAVVAADEITDSAMVTDLESVARVVVEPWNGPVATAFGVKGVPAFCLLDPEGVVIASAPLFSRVTTPVAA